MCRWNTRHSLLFVSGKKEKKGVLLGLSANRQKPKHMTFPEGSLSWRDAAESMGSPSAQIQVQRDEVHLLLKPEGLTCFGVLVLPAGLRVSLGRASPPKEGSLSGLLCPRRPPPGPSA